MADIEMPKSIPCKFEIAWQGRCNKPSTNGWCSEHERLKCTSCGAKATRSCERTGSLVCGASLCDTCQHSIKDGSHVTKEVFDAQVELERLERVAVEQSRSSPDQRLNSDGNPVNLFELLKQDPKGQGYLLERVFSLQLTHSLMGFFPAVIYSQRRVIICIDRNLLVEIWKTLEPRKSQLDSLTYYVNREKGIAYVDVDRPSEREESKPEKVLTRDEYEKIKKEDPDSIMWAPGLIGGVYFSPEQFVQYVDRKVASLS